MGCKYQIAFDGTVVLEKWTGDVSMQDLMAHKMRLLEEPTLKQGAAVLSDCREAKFSFSSEAVGDLSNMENASFDSKIERYAFLVSNAAYGRAQQFADKVNQFRKTVIVFNSLDVAAIWLGQDLAAVSALFEDMTD